MVRRSLAALVVAVTALCGAVASAQTPAADKARAIAGGNLAAAVKVLAQSDAQASADSPGGGGYRASVSGGGVTIPVVVVGGTPRQMGWHLGRLMGKEIQTFVPQLLAKVKGAMGIDDAQLAAAWGTQSAWIDDRVEQEIVGMAEGAGVPLAMLQAVHAVPLLMPYSCSAISAWGSATADGHLYQTRNLDWELELGAHEHGVIVVYIPTGGTAHLLPTFAGFSGANCGLSAAGIALSEMGDSPAKEMPYELHAPHFTTWFRTLLYDADSLTEALDIFTALPRTKKYHFVFGDGRADRRGVKIRAHTGPGLDEVKIWNANDPGDELAPAVLPDLVYQDEGRGAFPFLKQHHGRLDAAKLTEVACAIPIKGSNVLDAVFDATDLVAYVSYAGSDGEAYQRPFVRLALAALDGDGDGAGDLAEGAGDANRNGRPDFLEASAPAADR
ncbi:MAG: C45 family autoproteolytic acyltransferase/hydrolase [Planctomycetaceae bacterium]